MPRWQEYRDGRLPPGSVNRTRMTAFRQVGWPGGWQPDLPETHLTTEQLAHIKNFKWNEGYGLERRKGWERVTTTVSGMDQAHLFHVHPVWTSSSLSAQPSFTQEVLYYNDDDGEVWYNTLGELLIEEFDSSGSDLSYSGQSMGGWSSSATNYFRTWNIDSVVFEDKIYISGLRFGGYSGTSTAQTHNGMASGASKPIAYDVLNDSWSRPDPHDLDGTTSGFPTARTLLSTYDRIFAGNVYQQGVYRYPSRIYWSDAGTAETWGTNSFIEVGLDDGSEITALVDAGDAIVVFKDNSMWLLLGTDEDTFALRNLSPRFGCRSSQGAVHYNGIVYWFDPHEGLMSWDGANFANVSEPINSTMMGATNYNRQADFRVNVQAYDDRIFVSMGDGTDHTDFVSHTYVYDVHLKVWTEYDFGISGDMAQYVTDHSHTGVGITDTGQAYFTGPIFDEIGIFRFEGKEGADEDVSGDVAIDAELRTGWFTVGDLGFRHRLRRFEAITNAEDSGEWDIELYRDFETVTNWQSDTWTPTGDNLYAYHEMNSGVDIKTMFTWLQMFLQANDINDVYKINGYQMVFSSRPFHRGVRGELNQNLGGGGGCI